MSASAAAARSPSSIAVSRLSTFRARARISLARSEFIVATGAIYPRRPRRRRPGRRGAGVPRGVGTPTLRPSGHARQPGAVGLRLDLAFVAPDALLDPRDLVGRPLEGT